jgi:hypothetical protein
VESYVGIHGTNLASRQRSQVILTLLTCGVSDLAELLEVDQMMLDDVCTRDENLSHVHKMRTRHFLERQALSHTGFERFATTTPTSSGEGPPTNLTHGTRQFSTRPRNSGVTLPAEFVAGRNQEMPTRAHPSLGVIAQHPEHAQPSSYRDPEPPLVKRARHSQSMRYIGGVSDRQRQSDTFANSGGGPGGPHTVQSDTTRCGASRVGHAAKRPRLQPIDSTSQ